jgi:protein-L-isoaspartate(D-aspartate) O-methyltransferase
MRNISVPHRSHSTLSSSVRMQREGVADGFDRMGWARRFCGTGLVGSSIAEDYKLNAMDLPGARERMVATQIASRGVHDAGVLAAMRDVPRHLFVPDAVRREAYEDRPLPIGDGQTISQPYIVAAMTATLAPRPTDRVLEIGTGSGYQAAILARLARSVVTIERHASLAARAAETLAALGISNVRVVVGDGSNGYPADAPYERILVTAGAPAIPKTLKAPLADGGRLVIPVGSEGFQQLMRIDRHGERQGTVFTAQEGEGCVFVPLIGQHGWPDRT